MIVSVFAFQQDEISEDTSCIDLNEHEKMETKVSMPRLYNFVYINWDSSLWKLLCFSLGITKSVSRYRLSSKDTKMIRYFFNVYVSIDELQSIACCHTKLSLNPKSHRTVISLLVIHMVLCMVKKLVIIFIFQVVKLDQGCVNTQCFACIPNFMYVH